MRHMDHKLRLILVTYMTTIADTKQNSRAKVRLNFLYVGEDKTFYKCLQSTNVGSVEQLKAGGFLMPLYNQKFGHC